MEVHEEKRVSSALNGVWAKFTRVLYTRERARGTISAQCLR